MLIGHTSAVVQKVTTFVAAGTEMPVVVTRIAPRECQTEG